MLPTQYQLFAATLPTGISSTVIGQTNWSNWSNWSDPLSVAPSLQGSSSPGQYPGQQYPAQQGQPGGFPAAPGKYPGQQPQQLGGSGAYPGSAPPGQYSSQTQSGQYSNHTQSGQCPSQTPIGQTQVHVTLQQYGGPASHTGQSASGAIGKSPDTFHEAARLASHQARGVDTSVQHIHTELLVVIAAIFKLSSTMPLLAVHGAFHGDI